MKLFLALMLCASTVLAQVVTPVVTTNVITAEIYDAKISDFPLKAGQCSALTVTVYGVDRRHAVVATPVYEPGNVTWGAYVLEQNRIVLKVCALSDTTPLPTAYTLRIIL